MKKYLKLVQQQKIKEANKKNHIGKNFGTENIDLSTKSSNTDINKGYKRSSLEPIRNRLGQYVMSLESTNKTNEDSVMRVKGKALNTFIGIMRADLL